MLLPRCCPPRAHRLPRQRISRHASVPRALSDDEQRRALEDELRDPATPLEFLLPRGLRRTLYGAAAGGAAVALAAGAQHAASSSALAAADGTLVNLGVDAAVLVAAAWAFVREGDAGEARVSSRAATRAAQVAAGDRTVVGERLLQVDDAWIVKRLERFAARDGLPSLGPSKAVALQAVIRARRPCAVLEIGTLFGYSAIKMAQALSDDECRVTTLEKELWNVLAARRFLWQCNQGERAAGEPRVGRRVRVEAGDAAATLARFAAEGRRFDFVLLDGTPRDTLAHCLAVQPLLLPGATVVAHNTVVFAASLAPHLAHVRAPGSGFSASEAVPAEFGFQGVPDALEVSTWGRAQ